MHPAIAIGIQAAQTERMANTVTVDEAPARWTDLVAAVGRGEEWLVVDVTGQPVVKLSPPDHEAAASGGQRWEAFGLMKGEIELGPDFDEPLEDFKPYME